MVPEKMVDRDALCPINVLLELIQPYTLVEPPVKRQVLAPLAVYSSRTVYTCIASNVTVSAALASKGL